MNKEEFTLQEIATMTKSTLVGDPQYKISNVADLDTAGSSDASFLSNPRYEQAMRRSSAGVVFIDSNTKPSENRFFLINENPSRAFQQLVEAFYGTHRKTTGFTGIHTSAVIHESAKLGKNVSIGPNAVIDSDVTIGDNSAIGAGCYIGPGTTIGNDCLFHANVSVREECVIGNRVIIQPGAVIGSCGFGYTTDKNGQHTKLNQVGNVTLDDDVEIGANTTIDRSRFKTTHVKRGSKIDNLVQLAHGVVIGEHNIVVSQTGIAGSSETGKHVVIGGQSAIAGHLTITNGVMLAGRSGVSKSITESGNYGGLRGVMPLAEYNRNSVILRNIESYISEIKALKARLAKLEEG